MKVKRLKCKAWKLFSSMTATEAAYMAAFWDGEGCFHLSPGKRKYPEARGSQANVLLYELTKPYGGCICYDPYKDKRLKTQYWYTLHTELLKEFLEAITPYMVFKKDQALLLLEAVNITLKYRRKPLPEEEKQRLDEIDTELKRLKRLKTPIPPEIEAARLVNRRLVARE